MELQAFAGTRIFDGNDFRAGVLVCDGGQVAGIAPAAPDGARVTRLQGGILAPGFVDLQVNGGDGLMLNDAPDIATLRRMADAHARLGTTTLLPTLITDTPEITRAAVEAAAEAVARGVAGIGGLHLEGPHLSLARKGAHDPALIRPMSDADLAFLLEARRRLPCLLVTLAPESATPDQISALSRAGIVVSLGHSDCSHAAALEAAGHGARMVTHLFNAMSQLGNREPGLVGAALGQGGLSAGLIADGIHVHPAAIRIALAAKAPPGRIFLVTDAMAPAGTGIAEFRLNGRRILRRDGRLTLEDGTLAGADLDFPRALRVMVGDAGVPPEVALAMATSGPAAAAGLRGCGTLEAGAQADFVHLSDGLELQAVWRGGVPVPAAS